MEIKKFKTDEIDKTVTLSNMDVIDTTKMPSGHEKVCDLLELHPLLSYLRSENVIEEDFVDELVISFSFSLMF